MSELDEYRSEISDIDMEIAELFQRRMMICKNIAEYKRQRGLPIRDLSRERDLTARNLEVIREEELRPFYETFLKNTIDISCAYQEKVMNHIIQGGEK